MFDSKKPSHAKKSSVKILRELPREFVRLEHSYRTRRGAHPAFAHYPTLDSLVDVLTRYVPDTKTERLALIGVLIHLQRESGDRVWTTLLLRVFRPMLNKIREKLVGEAADELDAALIAAFLEALRAIDTKDPVWIPKHVRWRTRRIVFRALKAKADWDDVGFGVECETEPDPATEGDLLLVGVWLREEHGDTESVELLRTLFEHGALGTLVMKRFDGCSLSEMRQAYRRLQRKRKRLIHRLRHRLRHEAREERLSQPSIPAAPVSSVALSEPETATVDVALQSGGSS
jgi:hypothetical protein